MSEKNREAKRSARERLQQERDQEKRRDRRRRTLVVSGAVVGVLGVAAAIGLVAANADKEKGASAAAGPVLAPSGAQGKDELSIPVGAKDAPSTLTVWEDFRCPACAQFENAFRDTIKELESAGQLKVEYHLATIIDGNMGGSGSLRAANAAACAQDAGKFVPYHDTLFQNQPPETDDSYADNGRLLKLAGKVEGLEEAPGFRQCVRDGKHDKWAASSNGAFQKGGFSGTPTVLLNGESVFPAKGSENITPAAFKKWVAEANKGKKPGTATGTPSGSGSGTGADTGTGAGPSAS